MTHKKKTIHPKISQQRRDGFNTGKSLALDYLKETLGVLEKMRFPVAMVGAALGDCFIATLISTGATEEEGVGVCDEIKKDFIEFRRMVLAPEGKKKEKE